MKSSFFLISILFLLGCSGGATDVGNPTEDALQTSFPEIGDLVGSFDSVATSSSDVVDKTVQCQSDSDLNKSILLGDEEGAVILENFFSYSEATQEIVADYDTSIGTLSFSIEEGSTDMSCSGEVSSINTSPLSITFSCEVNSPVSHSCSLQFNQSE